MIEQDLHLIDSIRKMLNDVFHVIEVRAKVGCIKNIVFEIKTKEQGHFEPHVHVRGENFESSISLITLKKIEGNLPAKNQKIINKWVEENIEVLRDKWCENFKYTLELRNALIGIS